MVILYGVMFFVIMRDGMIDDEEESKKVAKILLLCVLRTSCVSASLTEIQQLPGGLRRLRRTIIRNPVDVFPGRPCLISSYPVFQYPVCPYRFLQPYPVLHHPPCPFERYTTG